MQTPTTDSPAAVTEQPVCDNCGEPATEHRQDVGLLDGTTADDLAVCDNCAECIDENRQDEADA